jgi:hypothetical protein
LGIEKLVKDASSPVAPASLPAFFSNPWADLSNDPARLPVLSSRFKVDLDKSPKRSILLSGESATALLAFFIFPFNEAP